MPRPPWEQGFFVNNKTCRIFARLTGKRRTYFGYGRHSMRCIFNFLPNAEREKLASLQSNVIVRRASRPAPPQGNGDFFVLFTVTSAHYFCPLKQRVMISEHLLCWTIAISLYPLWLFIKLARYGRSIIRPNFDRIKRKIDTWTGVPYDGRFAWNRPFGKCLYYLLLLYLFSAFSYIVFCLAR